MTTPPPTKQFLARDKAASFISDRVIIPRSVTPATTVSMNDTGNQQSGIEKAQLQNYDTFSEQPIASPAP